jgi:GT2 family glycosyltransferase
MIDRAKPVAAAASSVSGAISGLDFTCDEDPRVSIILGGCGDLPATVRCLRSIQAHRSQVPHEVLVIVGASGNKKLDQLSQVPGLRYHSHAADLEVVNANNTGATLARGEYVFFLDADTEVTAGWLEAALGVFERFPDCEMVGAKRLSPDGCLKEAGGILWMDGSLTPFGSGQESAAPEYNYVREVDWCSPGASMLRTRVFIEVGGFDEACASAEASGAGLGLRLRQRGGHTYFCPGSVIVSHSSHAPPDRDGGHQGSDRRRIHGRWRHVLERRHYPSGRCDFRAREHARHKRYILVMDHAIPQPDRDAGSRAMLQTMLQFIRMGLVVKFWPDDHRYGSEYRHLLEDAGIEVLTPQRRGGSFESFIRDHGNELDFAILSRPNFAGPYIPLLRRHSRARIVFFGHDVHFQRMLAQAGVTSDEKIRAGAEAMRQTELDIWRAVDSIIYSSPDEANLVSSCVGISKSHAVPAYSLEAELQTRRQPTESIELLFVAGFGHPPNVDAAQWLVGSIFPQIRKRLAEARLHLVGSHPTEEVLALASEDVLISPNVSPEALARSYASATVAIVPLRFGGGVKLKVVEAMAHGVPLVTTSVGAQGLPALGDCISVADDEATIVEAVARLVTDKDHAQRQADLAREYVRTNYSARSMQAPLWRALVGQADAAFAYSD